MIGRAGDRAKGGNEAELGAETLAAKGDLFGTEEILSILTAFKYRYWSGCPPKIPYLQ